jgi:MFS superfamily sulfate permease-like transporter
MSKYWAPAMRWITILTTFNVLLLFQTAASINPSQSLSSAITSTVLRLITDIPVSPSNVDDETSSVAIIHAVVVLVSLVLVVLLAIFGYNIYTYIRQWKKQKKLLERSRHQLSRHYRTAVSELLIWII